MDDTGVLEVLVEAWVCGYGAGFRNWPSEHLDVALVKFLVMHQPLGVWWR
jgi:hypothetical protein